MRNKFLIVLLALVLTVGYSGCKNDKNTEDTEKNNEIIQDEDDKKTEDISSTEDTENMPSSEDASEPEADKQQKAAEQEMNDSLGDFTPIEIDEDSEPDIILDEGEAVAGG